MGGTGEFGSQVQTGQVVQPLDSNLNITPLATNYDRDTR
jgi:hypothetical protein